MFIDAIGKTYTNLQVELLKPRFLKALDVKQINPVVKFQGVLTQIN